MQETVIVTNLLDCVWVSAQHHCDAAKLFVTNFLNTFALNLPEILYSAQRTKLVPRTSNAFTLNVPEILGCRKGNRLGSSYNRPRRPRGGVEV
jgi:hypothetical protein